MAPSCAAVGDQELLEDGEFENELRVLEPHNHLPPDENTIKRQMFYNIMKKKMQNDRTLNIRNIYEDCCEQ